MDIFAFFEDEYKIILEFSDIIYFEKQSIIINLLKIIKLILQKDIIIFKKNNYLKK